VNWLDCLIIAILALSALQGMRCGLFVSVARLAGILSGLVVAFSYYKPLSEYLSINWHLDEKILIIAEPLVKYLLPAKSALFPVVPPVKIMSFWFNPADILNVAVVPPGTIWQLNTFSDSITGALAYGILEIISFIVLLITTSWLVKFAGYFLTRITDISLLGPLNHFGGLLFGLFKGLLVVMIVLTIISPFQHQNLNPEIYSFPPGTTSMQSKAFKESTLLPYFEFLLKKVGLPLLDGFQKNNDMSRSLKSI